MPTRTFESYLPTLNAFSSVCVPADPAATAVFGVPDVAAGSLARTLAGGATDPFGMQVIRLYRQGSAMHAFNVKVSNQDGVTLCNELDLQAQNLYGATDFAALYASDPADANSIVSSMISGNTVPFDPLSGGKAGIRYLAVLGNFLVQLAYYTNFPEHTLRASLLRLGSGEPVFTDAANQIAAPNNRPPGFGGTATFVSAHDYTAYPFPLRKAVEDQYADAFLEWKASGTSEASFTALVAAWGDGSILTQGT